MYFPCIHVVALCRVIQREDKNEVFDKWTSDLHKVKSLHHLFKQNVDLVITDTVKHDGVMLPYAL